MKYRKLAKQFSIFYLCPHDYSDFFIPECAYADIAFII